MSLILGDPCSMWDIRVKNIKNYILSEMKMLAVSLTVNFRTHYEESTQNNGTWNELVV